MRAAEVAKLLSTSENFVIKILGDRDFDMVEVMAYRDKWRLDTLELADRFYNYDENTDKLIEDMMNHL